MTIPILETARLRLRPFAEADLPRWAAVMAHPVTTRHFGGTPVAREDAWRRLLSAIGLWSVYGYGYWAVVRPADDVVVGQVGLSDFKRDMVPSIEGIPEAGWIFAPDAHGQGYATEAMTAVIDWFEQRFGRREIAAIIDAANLPSIGVAERTGFSVREQATYKGAPILLFRRPAGP